MEVDPSQQQASTSSNVNQDQQQQSTAMEVCQAGGPEHLEDFLNTGRTGRRNAVPDLVDDRNAAVTTADLPGALEKLSCGEGTSSASSSSSSCGQPSTSTQPNT